MSWDRFIKYINITVGVLLAVVLAAIYWYAWRPLPKTSGTVSVFIDHRATAARDAFGVPHIQAESQDDALFVQGYVTAQDRMWQMEGLRRAAAGELAEILGTVALDSDREARRLRMRRIAEEARAALPPGDRSALSAYARGVNAYLSTHLDRLPLEFRLLGYQPRPWTIVDSLLVGLQMFRNLTTTWKDEIQKRSLLAGGDPGKVNLLFPPRSGREVQPGSNSWAIGGAHTASGRPILSNDMHLEFSIPGIWYMLGLRAEGLDVTGVSLPGVPGVTVGHNGRIAWGITNLQFDVQDLYREQLDFHTGHYRFRGNMEQARAERELILVKGSSPEELNNWVTRHGPVFLADGKEILTLRWTGAETEKFRLPFLEINRARNWREFTAAVASLPGPGLNFLYADAEGNIGYQVAGKLPIRRSYGGDVPVDGASGDYEWDGFIPFEKLPSAYNPAGGIIVSANQNPFPADYPYRTGGNFASYYRSSQIRELLGAREGWRAADMLTVQKDVYSGFSAYLAQALVQAYDRRKASNPVLTEPIEILRKWNGQMDQSQPAPLIITLAFQHLRKAVADSASTGKGTVYEFPMASAVIENLLRTRPPGWFRDYDEELLRSFADAVDEGSRIQGRNPRKWIYGSYLQLLIAHPVGHRLPLVARFFDVGPVPMSGASTTVKQTTHRLGPSMRMSVDFGDLEKSLLNVTLGQSGHVLSSHYKDQWRYYYAAQSLPMQFGNVKAKDVLVFVPERN